MDTIARADPISTRTAPEAEPPSREEWAARRARMEAGHRKFTPTGVRPLRYWPYFDVLLHIMGYGLRLTGLYGLGVRNALDLRVNRLELFFPDLPKPFDGYRILHLTDLHLDELEGTTATAISRVRGLEADACVLTGDFRRGTAGPYRQILPLMSELVTAIRASDGIYATLGNHDCAAMVDPLESLGIRVLINETIRIERARTEIYLTGLDDVHYFYTESARKALDRTPGGFRIALVHSPEIADMAARAGFSLYLAGHTHGGQICLPGGRPIFTHLHRCRDYAAGLWKCGDMLGYTSTGTGVSGLPVRFNTRGEVVLITLRRSTGPVSPIRPKRWRS